MSATTLNFDPTTQDPRLLAAFRDFFAMPSATNGQVQAAYKAWLIRMTRDVVFTYENREAVKAIAPSSSFDPS